MGVAGDFACLLFRDGCLRELLSVLGCVPAQAEGCAELQRRSQIFLQCSIHAKKGCCASRSKYKASDPIIFRGQYI